MLRHYVRRAARAATQIVFARRRFKLLLRTTLEDVDLRLHALSSAMDFFAASVQPIVIEAPFGKSMMVVAPHQDDEVIGCGGAMTLQTRSGRAAVAVVLQDGADEYAQVSMTRSSLRELRNEESRAAARIIGAEEPIFLGRSDLRRDSKELSATLRQIVETRQADVIFTPFVLDGHPDHRVCNAILAEALQGVARHIRVLQYEVWGNCIPNVVVVIDNAMEAKRQMLSCFEFANRAVDYAHSTTGLNMFRSRLLPAGTSRYVEAFFETPRDEFLEMVRVVGSAEQESSGANALAGTTATSKQAP